jgi:hypothetical protein
MQVAGAMSQAGASAVPACRARLRAAAQWPAAPIRLSTRAGLHRFTWDLRFDPFGEDRDAADEGATDAVPHHAYDLAYSPWAPLGTYTARLTVDGKRYEQPITLRLDPRVNTPAAGLTQLNTLTRELYDDAAQAHHAYTEARALIARLGSGGDAASLKTRVDAIAPAETGERRGRGFGPGAGGGAPRQTLASVSEAAMAAAMAMQGADMAPTAGQVAAAAKARADVKALMDQWSALQASSPVK